MLKNYSFYIPISSPSFEMLSRADKARAMSVMTRAGVGDIAVVTQETRCNHIASTKSCLVKLELCHIDLMVKYLVVIFTRKI